VKYYRKNAKDEEKVNKKLYGTNKKTKANDKEFKYTTKIYKRGSWSVSSKKRVIRRTKAVKAIKKKSCKRK
jgi:hypothetical protein